MSISGGAVQDWTAPNNYNVIPASLQQTAWSNLEDLAMWSESYGGANNPSYTMAGGSGMHSVGVFMAPNASPFTVKGGGVQNLTNAQYIATSFATTGGAQLNMRVDPNNTVTLPKLVSFTMVR